MIARLSTLLLLPLVASLALAQDAPDPAEAAKTLAKLADKKLGAIAKTHYALARTALSLGLNRAGCRHAREVLVIDPDDSKARKLLGYRKKGKEWEEVKPLSKADSVKGDRRKAAEKKLAGYAASKLQNKAARAYYDLAMEAKKLGLEQDKESYLYRCLGYDRDHKDARKELGYYKNKFRRWVFGPQANWLGAKDLLGKIDEQESKYETEIGVKLNKVSAPRMWIAGQYPPKVMQDMARHGGAAINSFHNLFQMSAFINAVSSGKQLKQIYLDSREDYGKFIDKFEQPDKKRAGFIKKLDFCNIAKEGDLKLVCFSKSNPETRDLQDRVIYLAGNQLSHFLCGGAPPWIAEGIAWGLTIRIVGTKDNLSVALAETASAYGEKDWQDHEQWRDYIREMVLLGDDPAIFSVLGTRDWNAISGEKAAVAWSMVDYLWRSRPKEFAKYCRLMDDESKQPDEACRESFGFGMNALAEHWRRYVRENY